MSLPNLINKKVVGTLKVVNSYIFK